MASFLDLLTQNQPSVQTRQALLVLGLQNDFIDPSGRLPVDLSSGFLERIESLVPVFRENAGDIIWVQTVFKGDRTANDVTGNGDTILLDPDGGLVSASEDEEEEELPKDAAVAPSKAKSSSKQRALSLFKKVGQRRQKSLHETVPATSDSATSSSQAPSALEIEEDENFLADSSRPTTCCRPNTTGAEFHTSAADLMDKTTDTIFQTSHYSAFNSTPLLINLRAKLITELYICGCLSNISVYATALDAARHGITINLLEDCLGYRKILRHDEAMKQIEEFMGAYPVSSEEVLTALSRPAEEAESVDRDSKGETVLRDLVKNLRIHDHKSSTDSTSTRDKKMPDHLQKEVEAALNRKSATSSSGSVAATNGAISNGALSPRSETQRNRPRESQSDHLVKAKPRMRQRNKRSAVEKLQTVNATPRDDMPPVPSLPTATSQTTSAPSTATKPSESKATATNGESAVTYAANQTPAAAPSPQSQVTALPTAPVKEKKMSKREHMLKLAKSHMSLKTDANKAAASSGSPISPTRPKSFAFLRSSASSANLRQDKDAGIRPHSLSSMGKKPKPLAPLPAPRTVEDKIAEGDSHLIHDFFPATLRHARRSSNPVKDEIFQWLYSEVHWQKMYHAAGEVPRLVCAQGEFGKDGSMPIYRHPSDHALPLLHFSPSVELIREQVEKLVNHPVNHVLIQLYRTGHDFISEHSDKTLDIVRGSSIVNVSFGAERTMRLRTKKASSTTTNNSTSPSNSNSNSNSTSIPTAPEQQPPSDTNGGGTPRTTQRIPLPHNSMFILGPLSNARWLHSIHPDKRRSAELSSAQKAYSGMRISLTFRHIGTFLDSSSQTIWGQGATSKAREGANDVINDDEEETQALINAMGFENQSKEFKWEEVYGSGFDVLHFRKPPAEVPLLFTTLDGIQNAQVVACLSELGIAYSVYEPPGLEGRYEGERRICLRDTDANHTEVVGAVGVLLYLDRYRHVDRSALSNPVSAGAYDILQQIESMRRAWISSSSPPPSSADPKLTSTTSAAPSDHPINATLTSALIELEETMALHRGEYIAGARFSIADCAAWPMVDALVREWSGWSAEGLPRLVAWWDRLGKRRGFRETGKGKKGSVA